MDKRDKAVYLAVLRRFHSKFSVSFGGILQVKLSLGEFKMVCYYL